jgi:hypothetical protein
MVDPWFRQKSLECARMAQDASRTDSDRAQCRQQEHLWLRIADIEERKEDARRLKSATK